MKQRILRAMARANDDPEFALAARLWDGDVLFASGAEAVRMRVAGGRVASVDEATSDATAMIRVSGPPDGWAKALQAVPPAFYHDLYGAMAQHGFTIQGRVEDVGPYYRALSRLVELAREDGAAH